jgi:iron complex transport system ATP-binding protein
MREYHRDGRTLVVISHDLNLPIALGGRVMALRDGEVAFDEPSGVLAQAERLRSLFDANFVIHRDAGGRVSGLLLEV